MRLTLAALLLCATPASAHVTATPSSAPAASYAVVALRVGHGCGDAATTCLRVTIPEALRIARPQPKPGWRLEIEHAPLATPATVEGREQRDRVAAIRWTGSLPADQFDDFALLVKTPDSPGPLYLPVEQSCGGTVQYWAEQPGPGQSARDLKHPAPLLLIEPPAADPGHAHH